MSAEALPTPRGTTPDTSTCTCDLEALGGRGIASRRGAPHRRGEARAGQAALCARHSRKRANVASSARLQRGAQRCADARRDAAGRDRDPRRPGLHRRLHRDETVRRLIDRAQQKAVPVGQRAQARRERGVAAASRSRRTRRARPRRARAAGSRSHVDVGADLAQVARLLDRLAVVGAPMTTQRRPARLRLTGKNAGGRISSASRIASEVDGAQVEFVDRGPRDQRGRRQVALPVRPLDAPPHERHLGGGSKPAATICSSR